jgi:hypothetical protein
MKRDDKDTFMALRALIFISGLIVVGFAVYFHQYGRAILGALGLVAIFFACVLPQIKKKPQPSQDIDQNCDQPS